MNQSVNIHLTKQDIIKNGSVFTKPNIVALVLEKIKPYINNQSVIADFGSGYGAFIEYFKDYGKRCFGTEIDDMSFDLLKQLYPNIDFYHENSLININREKYNIDKNDELIIIGNPPYNDTTSLFQKGNKGELVCDQDIISRDFGVSFLKAYNKLNAKYICVLHPLAYLIKKQNFGYLEEFRANYRLLDATIFSSKEFESLKRSNLEFPVVAALYERNDLGMNYDYIQNFDFKIYNSNKIFNLCKIKTIDGIVSKYPKAGCTTGLQFYTLRDMNALLRNIGFIENRETNGIPVNDNNLFHYAWLQFLKDNFKK